MLHSNHVWHTTILFWHPALRKRRAVTQAGMYMMYSSSRSDRHRDTMTQWTEQPERHSVWQDEARMKPGSSIFYICKSKLAVWKLSGYSFHASNALFYTTWLCSAITRKKRRKFFTQTRKSCILCINHLRFKWRFVTLSDWEDYQKPTNWSQHPEPTLVSPQSEIVSLRLLFDTKALILTLAAKALRWEWDEESDTAEAVIGQVSGEDAKSSGQRATERGRLSHPADLAKTDETISSPRPGQFFSPACSLCLRAAFHNISNLNSPFTLLQRGGEAWGWESFWILGILKHIWRSLLVVPILLLKASTNPDPM